MLQTKPKTLQIPEALVCDSCGKEVNVDDFDFQEFLRIDFLGGYSSVFGDENQVQCDLCQECVKQRFGDCLRINDFSNDQ